MVITGLVMPAVLHMIYVTAQMAAAQPVHDPAVAAISQLQSVFSEIDPVRVCLSPAGTGRRDQCLTTSEAVGVSLVQPPPDALEIDPMTICWLARPDNPDTSPQIETGLKTQCLMLRDDGNDTPFAPDAKSETSETDRQTSRVDPRGGDELIVRTYDIKAPDGADPALPHRPRELPAARRRRAELGRPGDLLRRRVVVPEMAPPQRRPHRRSDRRAVDRELSLPRRHLRADPAARDRQNAHRPRRGPSHPALGSAPRHGSTPTALCPTTATPTTTSPFWRRRREAATGSRPPDPTAPPTPTTATPQQRSGRCPGCPS